MHADTEGNPFFVEEVILHLEEEDRLFDDKGEYRSDLSLAELDVPESVVNTLDLELILLVVLEKLR